MLPKDGLPITIDGSPHEFYLHWMTGREELGRPFSFELELYSEKPDVEVKDVLGKPMTVCLDLGDYGTTRFWNGIVTRMWKVGLFERYVVVRATLSPKLWQLQRTRDVRIFQNMSVPDIVKKVLDDYGVLNENKTTGTYKTWDYLVQYRESDFNFVSRLLEHEGIYYYFKHEQAQHTLVLSDGLSSHDAVPHYDKVIVWTGSSAQAHGDHLSGWRIVNNTRGATFELQAHDFRLKKGAQISADTHAEHFNEDEDKLESYDYFEHYRQIDNADSAAAGDLETEGKRYAKVLTEEEGADRERLEGEGNVRGMNVGSLFQFDPLYAPDAPTEKYLIASTYHDLRNSAFQSGDSTSEVEETCTMHFSSINGEKYTFAPAKLARKPRVSGVETAIVVGPSGEEIYTDKHGRIKVQFHWDYEGKNDENSSCWVRVSQPWAGANWGAIWIPRIGHEVVVQFLGGDPDRPIVTGSVYNADNTPPYALPANATQSGIKSRSSKGGGPANFNEIRMEDKKGSEQLYIHAEKNQDNMVENDATLTVGHDRTKKIGHDETTKVGHDRTETVDNDETITINGKRTETVMKDETITINGARTETVMKDETITITGNETTTIVKNETNTIAISKTVTVGAALTITVGGAMALTVGAAVAVSVGGAMAVTVGAKSGETVAGSKSVEVGGGSTHSAGKDMSMDAGKNVAIKGGENFSAAGGKDAMISAAKNGSFSAGDELKLACGDASITLKKNGDIAIKGNKIDIKGDGNITIKGSKIEEN